MRMRYRCNQAGSRGAEEHKVNRELPQTVGNETASQDAPLPLKKAKRFRSAFTTEQIKYLDAEFRKYPYIGSARRKEVSNALKIPERAVKIWFQNRRMKEKKDVPTYEPDCDEHKHSRKIDFGNDQLSNECTVTSTNNQNYAPLPLISPKVPKNVVTISIKRENEIHPANVANPSQKANTTQCNSPPEFSIEIFKPYDICNGKNVSNVGTLLEVDTKRHSQPTTLPSPKHEVSSTSSYDKLPQDLSRKRQLPQIKPMTVPESSGGYFPLNLKKYCAQPSLPGGGSMIWRPVQVVPIMNYPKEPVGCRCDCRCRPPLLHGASDQPQYVLTALPLQNPYYKY